jgi:hypothetical protein
MLAWFVLANSTAERELERNSRTIGEDACRRECGATYLGHGFVLLRIIGSSHGSVCGIRAPKKRVSNINP